MKPLLYLTRRNTKMFFKDKGTLLTAMITPLILLLLFVTFLGNVYRESIISCIPEGMTISKSLIEGFTGGWLFSSLLAVCCVTVAFCANLMLVSDKVTGARNDFLVSPVKKTTLSFSYYLSTAFITIMICMVTTAVCFIYLACSGWYLTIADALFVILDVVILTLFGTALSAVVCFFLTTQGQISAVEAVISAAYGFLCGAYMPISEFSPAIRKLMGFLPGTYGTSLLRNHLMRGSFNELQSKGVPAKVVSKMRDAFDNNIYFFDNKVSIPQMYIVLGSAVIVLVVIYLFMNAASRKRAK